jgi:MoxR-like ATPase
MPKMNTQKPAKKESAESGPKSPDRKKPMLKKRTGGGAHDDDDASVDSRGNIRGLITYDSEEEFVSEEDTPSDMSSLSPKQRHALRRSARTAAKKASKRIKKDAEKNTVNTRRPIIESESEEEEEEDEEEEVVKPKKRGFLPKKRAPLKKSRYEEEDTKEEETEDEDAEEEEEEGDEETEETDEDEDDYDDEEEDNPGRNGLIISFGGGEEEENRMIPKRHNMKKESPAVKKFVELVTKPHEEGGIDEQIDEFKRLSQEKQTELLMTLDRKADVDSKSQSMMFKILDMKLTPETQSMVLAKYNALQTMEPGAGEYYKQRAWLEKFSSLPLGIYRDIPVKMSDGQETCGAFMMRAQRCLADAIYGQEEAKIQILQFIASKIANPDARGLSLLLSGPPGIGKTSLIKNGIAKALNWPFQFISLGGDSDASTYMGHQLVYEGSHCGKIANSLIGAKSLSMVLMFDELDKISATAKGEEVQNLLVHLTDPVQNGEFEDKYLSGIPLDLSRVLFTFSANDLGKIDRVLMDRMVVIELQGYSLKEKMSIAQIFLLPSALKEVNLDEKVSISQEMLEHILKEYASEEKGVRELKRCIEAIVQKINMLRIFNTKDLPFHIPDFQLPFVVKKQHIDLFLKKKSVNASHLAMYT